MSFFGALKSGLAAAVTGFRLAFGSYSDAAYWSPDRGQVFLHLAGSDTRQPADAWTRRVILQKVTWLFQNFGIIKEACRGLARHTVGKGICLSFNTDDDEWNALAEAYFEAWAMAPDRCDLAGRRNFYEIQNFSVFQRTKQGEFLAAFVTNPRWDGAPCLQIFDALELETPAERLDDPYCIDGVGMDRNHCPVAYYITGIDGATSEYPRSEFIHWYFADEANQVRAVSEFAQAVAPMQDARELMNLTTKTAKQNAAIGLHIKKLVKNGQVGGIDKLRTLQQRRNIANGAEPGPANEDGKDHANYERLAGGGAIIYTDGDGDAKFLTPNSPTPLVEPYVKNVLMRNGLNSIGGAGSDFFWALADVNSAGQRAILLKADLTFVTLGEGVIGHLCTPAATRVILDAMTRTELRKPLRRVLVNPVLKPGVIIDAEEAEPVESWVEDNENHWMNCLSWQLPARVSIDNSRDGKTEIDQLSNGIETLASLQDRRGRGWRGVVDQWFKEWAYASKVATRLKVPFALKLWRCSMPGAQGGDPTGNEDAQDAKDPQEKDTPPAKS